MGSLESAWEPAGPELSPAGTAENIPGCNPGLQHSPVGQELYVPTQTRKPPKRFMGAGK